MVPLNKLLYWIIQNFKKGRLHPLRNGYQKTYYLSLFSNKFLLFSDHKGGPNQKKGIFSIQKWQFKHLLKSLIEFRLGCLVYMSKYVCWDIRPKNHNRVQKRLFKGGCKKSCLVLKKLNIIFKEKDEFTC